MERFLESISAQKASGEALFYNSSGSKQAYQLSVKHISAAEPLGFTLTLPNRELRVIKAFILVDFEKKELHKMKPGQQICPVKLKSL